MNEQLSQLLGLGPNAEWPYTEKSLIEVINLQKEKEITKQQYYKLENINKSTELLNRCIHANIPPYLIPIVFSGETLNEEVLHQLAQSQVEQHRSALSTTPQIRRSSGQRSVSTNYQQYPLQPFNPQRPQHQQQHTQPPQQNPPYSQSPGNLATPANLGPPVNLHRPLSPAKIGAAAVAQLDRGRYPTSPVHRRNHSMPVHTNLPSHSGNGGTPIPTINVSSPTYNQRQSAMMGTMSSIQFISENPGKLKRRRSSDNSIDQQIEEEEKEGSEDEESGSDKTKLKALSGSPSLTPGRFVKGHSRTKSDNFFTGKRNSTPSSSNLARSPVLKDSTVNKQLEKTKNQSTPTSGPKFANNILSPSS